MGRTKIHGQVVTSLLARWPSKDESRDHGLNNTHQMIVQSPGCAYRGMKQKDCEYKRIEALKYKS